jgi:type II secretory pathway component GspD/PulD (secretin)
MTARNQIRPHNRPWPLRAFADTIFILIMVLAIVPSGHASDKQFSMQIQDKTLAEVFQDLTQMSGRTIVFDKEWTDQPINIRFVNLTLEMAIAKILTNLNHVVIFEQDNIQVKIFGVVTPDKGSYQAPAAAQHPNETATEHEIRPLARPLPISTRQNDEMEDESASEEATDPETAEAEDTENTNEEKIPEDQEETDENEVTSPENDKDTESGNASD